MRVLLKNLVTVLGSINNGRKWEFSKLNGRNVISVVRLIWGGVVLGNG